MWGWIGTLFRGVHTVGLGMESGNDWMRILPAIRIVTIISAGCLSALWAGAEQPAARPAPVSVQKIGAAEVRIQRADGAAFTVRFMETVMATVVNPAHPLAAVFTTDEQPDSPLVVPPQPVATRSLYILSAVTGEFERVPTDDTMLGSWFFPVWSPGGSFAVILTSQWGGFKIFRVSNWINSAGQLRIDWRAPWRIVGAQDHPSPAADPAKIHCFVAWEGPAAFSFRGSCCGTEFTYRFDIEQDRLELIGQRELP